MVFHSHLLKKDIITKRQIENDLSMQEAAKEIGISKATLCRAEKEKTIDIATFGKLCEWLGKDPNRYFESAKFFFGETV